MGLRDAQLGDLVGLHMLELNTYVLDGPVNHRYYVPLMGALTSGEVRGLRIPISDRICSATRSSCKLVVIRALLHTMSSAELRRRAPYPDPALFSVADPAAQHRKPARPESSALSTLMTALPFVLLLSVLYFILRYSVPTDTGLTPAPLASDQLSEEAASLRRVRIGNLDGPFSDEIEGHADFGDGRRTTVRQHWAEGCEACHWVNVMLGNGGQVHFAPTRLCFPATCRS